MRNKEVISLKDGCRIGCVNDIEIDLKCAEILSIIVYGRFRCFGLFGREEDIIIKWEDIEVIGDDTILVKNHQHFFKKKKKSGFLGGFFRGYR